MAKRFNLNADMAEGKWAMMKGYYRLLVLQI